MYIRIAKAAIATAIPAFRTVSCATTGETLVNSRPSMAATFNVKASLIWLSSEGITLPAETEETFQLCPNEWPLYEDELIAPFRELWDATYAKRGLGWDANPWV